MPVPYAAIGAGIAGYGLVKDLFFNDSSRAGRSGAFPASWDLEGLGMDFNKFLQERLTTPVEQTKQFDLGSAAIRDQLTGLSATARQRLGDSASTGGFLDSGQVARGETDIARGEFQAMGEALTALILGLEGQRTDLVLPYLAAASGESVNIDQINAGVDTAARGQGLGFWASFLSGDSDKSASGLTSLLSFLPGGK